MPGVLLRAQAPEVSQALTLVQIAGPHRAIHRRQQQLDRDLRRGLREAATAVLQRRADPHGRTASVPGRAADLQREPRLSLESTQRFSQ